MGLGDLLDEAGPTMEGGATRSRLESHHTGNTPEQEKQDHRGASVLPSCPALVTSIEYGQMHPVCPLPLHVLGPRQGAFPLSA